MTENTRRAENEPGNGTERGDRNENGNGKSVILLILLFELALEEAEMRALPCRRR